MPLRQIIALVCVLGLPACAVAVRAEATELRPRDAAFTFDRVLVAASMPPQFDLMLEREMPTPGWRFEIDEIDVDAEAGRIVARVTERRPAGVAAQVITPTVCRIPLGTLARGRWVLEIRLRRGDEGPHRAVQALVFDAR